MLLTPTPNTDACVAWQWSALSSWQQLHPRRGTNTSLWTVRRSRKAGGGVVHVGLATGPPAAAERRSSRQSVGPLSMVEQYLAAHGRRWSAQPQRVELVVTAKDADSANIWHRMTAIFSAWLTAEVARRRAGLRTSSSAIHVLHHRAGSVLHPDFEVLFTRPSLFASLRTYSHILLAPPDGLLWDLAWDNELQCKPAGGSSIWQSFVRALESGLGLPPHAPPQQPPPPAGEQQPTMCLVRRTAATFRRLRPAQLGAVQASVRSVGVWRLRELQYQPTQPLKAHALATRPCAILIGMHGAGMIHSMWMRPGSAVVEMHERAKMLPHVVPPQYYRHIAEFSGHT